MADSQTADDVAVALARIFSVKKRTWAIFIDGKPYEIQMQDNVMLKERVVQVDGQIIATGVSASFEYGDDQVFPVGGHLCSIRTRSNGLVFRYDLSVDQKIVERDRPLELLPRWAWLGVFACLAIPFVTQGGETPILAGVIGAVLSALLANNTRWSSYQRFWSLVAITVSAWIAVFVVYGAVAGGHGLSSRANLEWETFTSNAGGFSVSMPGPAIETQEPFDTVAGHVIMQSASFTTTQEIYQVFYGDLPLDYVQKTAPYDFILSVRSNSIKSLGAQMVKSSSIQLNGYRGVEYILRVTPRSAKFLVRLQARVYLLDQRFYILLVWMPEASASETDINKFLNSFILLNP